MAETITCPNCQVVNDINARFCSNCGMWLHEVETRSPLIEEEGEDLKAKIDQLLAEVPDPSEVPEIAAGSFALVIIGTPHTITVDYKQPMMLGRDAGGRATVHPLIDLNEYRAYVMGVSRQHAILKQVDAKYFLNDQASSNGTFINGERLEAYKDYELKNGDRIILGQLVLGFYVG